MEDYVAFGPNEDVALVVQLGKNEIAETMHFHMWHVRNYQAMLPQIVDLFFRIAGRWNLLFETSSEGQFIIQDKTMLISFLSGL